MRAFFIATLLLISFSAFSSEMIFKIARPENIRLLKKDVLEIAEPLPAGTTLSIESKHSPETHLFRNANGSIERSSNGFIPHVKIVASELSPSRMDELNQLNLWITISAIPQQTSAHFPAIELEAPKTDYLLSFEESGRPRFNFTSYYKNRFPKSLNRSIASHEQTESERRKWRAIMRELEVAGDRSRETQSHFLFMPVSEATEASIAYENSDTVMSSGAWAIAVKATAVRHGFANVPCAEFMSEMIKQAYKRAGYDVFEDFNEASGTRLSWDKTAAVVNLTNTLYKAGWVPWELASFRPPTGAIMAHFKATTPGHVYMAAGHDGRLVMDNGSPGGRQLFNSSDKLIKMMYYGGVFFLPPGITPASW